MTATDIALIASLAILNIVHIVWVIYAISTDRKRNNKINAILDDLDQNP